MVFRRARPTSAPTGAAPTSEHATARRSVPCITCVSEWSDGLLVAQPSSVFDHPPSQPTGAQTQLREFISTSGDGAHPDLCTNSHHSKSRWEATPMHVRFSRHHTPKGRPATVRWTLNSSDSVRRCTSLATIASTSKARPGYPIRRKQHWPPRQQGPMEAPQPCPVPRAPSGRCSPERLLPRLGAPSRRQRWLARVSQWAARASRCRMHRSLHRWRTTRPLARGRGRVPQ